MKKPMKKQLRKPVKKTDNKSSLYGTEGRNWS